MRNKLIMIFSLLILLSGCSSSEINNEDNRYENYKQADMNFILADINVEEYLHISRIFLRTVYADYEFRNDQDFYEEYESTNEEAIITLVQIDGKLHIVIIPQNSNAPVDVIDEFEFPSYSEIQNQLNALEDQTDIVLNREWIDSNESFPGIHFYNQERSNLDFELSTLFMLYIAENTETSNEIYLLLDVDNNYWFVELDNDLKNPVIIIMFENEKD